MTIGRVAQLALALGRKDLAEQFLKRSQSWRNIFDPDTGFARPRKANGEWVTPFDPYHTPGFVEGNAWQYTWFVPQDVPGLVQAMGRDRFISRLTEAFEKSAPTRFNAAGERFEDYPINQGNQPTMHVAWLFNWAGAALAHQKWARAILEAYYGHGPADAYLGDEDQGQMSSWFVMSSLGLFQTDGGCRVNPIYELGSPLYPKAVIHLSKQHYGGKTFTIVARNASKENRFIQSARLNGRPLNQMVDSAEGHPPGRAPGTGTGPHSPTRNGPKAARCQIDSHGGGAAPGSFEAESYGVGPVIPCARKLGQTKAVLGGSWLAQFHVENTTKGNFIWFKLGLVFQPPLSEYGSNGIFRGHGAPSAARDEGR